MNLETALLLALILAIGSSAVWLLFLRGPRLAHTLLPPYEIPDVILVGGVVVENRGRQAAPNVSISIRFDEAVAAKIHHMDVQSDEPYILRSGGEQFNFATLRLREMRPDKRVFVYWAMGSHVQPQVTISFYQPPNRLQQAAFRLRDQLSGQ